MRPKQLQLLLKEYEITHDRALEWYEASWYEKDKYEKQIKLIKYTQWSRMAADRAKAMVEFVERWKNERN